MSLTELPGVIKKLAEIEHAGQLADLENEIDESLGRGPRDPYERYPGAPAGQRLGALVLLGLEVAHRGAVLDGSHAGDDPGLQEQRLSQGGLAGPPMAHEHDVADRLRSDLVHANPRWHRGSSSGSFPERRWR